MHISLSLKWETIIILIFLFCFETSYAQKDTLSIKESKWLYRVKGSPYEFPPSVSESTLSIVPEIHLGKNLFFSIGFSKDKYNFYRKGIMTGKNWMVGIEYSPFNNIFVPKLSFSASAILFNFRISSLLYLTSEETKFAVRP